MKLPERETHRQTLTMMQETMELIKEKCRYIEDEREKISQKIAKLQAVTTPTKPTTTMKTTPNEKPLTTQKKSAPIFITARFRSGSTFLWNFFSNIQQATAFYEPLQENLPQHLIRQTPSQGSHVGVRSYWQEYSHIKEELTQIHRSAFGFRKLLLEKDEEYPELKKYIDFLLHSSQPETTPVLQFNRVDFRLPWLKEQFPEAIIIHLYRNPRDQWFSMVKEHLPEDVADSDINTNYDLLLWTVYLAKHFPFLTDGITSSYERHYYIWRLSEIMGKRCAHTSIDYDHEIQSTPEIALQKINQLTDITSGYEKDFISQIAPVHTGRWAEIRPAQWFEAIETKCEKKLKELGLIDFFGLKPLTMITQDFNSAWQSLTPEGSESLLEKTISLFLDTRGKTSTTIANMASSIDKINDDLNNLVESSNEVAVNSQKVVDKFIERTKHLQ